MANVTLYFADTFSFYNAVYFANAIGDLYPSQHSVTLQYASQGAAGIPNGQDLNLYRLYGASLSESNRKQVVDQLIDPASNEILAGRNVVQPNGTIFQLDADYGAVYLYGHAPRIRHDLTINFRDQANPAKNYALAAGRYFVIHKNLQINAFDYAMKNELIASERDVRATGIKISDNDPNRRINVTFNDFVAAPDGGAFVVPSVPGDVDFSEFPTGGIWLDNAENLTINNFHLGPTTVYGGGERQAPRVAPVLNRGGAQLTLTGSITAAPNFNYTSSLLANQGDLLIKDATLRAFDRNSPVAFDEYRRFGGSRRPQGAIVNSGKLTVRNSRLFQEADRQTDLKSLNNVIPFANNARGADVDGDNETPNWPAPRELAYLIRNQGSASLDSSVLAGILLQETIGQAPELSIKDSHLGYAETSNYANLLIDSGALELDRSTVDKLSLGSKALLKKFSNTLVVKSDTNLPGPASSNNGLQGLDLERPSLFVPIKDSYRFSSESQVDSEFWHTTYDPSRLNPDVVRAVNAALSGASTGSNPHILSHTSSFAATLSPDEKATDQTITVSTDSIGDGVSLSLALGGKTYTAAVRNDSATFTVPAADLAALAVGVAAFTVSGIASGSPIPDYQRSFNVDGAPPAATPHFEAILPSFGTVLEASELSGVSTLLVRTSGFAAGDPLRLLLDGVAVPAISGGVVQANGEASFSIPAAVLAGLGSGLHRFRISGVSKAGVAAADAELPFSADGAHNTVITPHVLSIVPSFGAVLSTLEAQAPQTVLVSTANLNDGDQLQLTLFGKTYTAAVAANQASFSLPVTDLQALPGGNSFLTISGPTSPAGAVQLPDAQQSFSKDTALPLQPHILSISPAFGAVLDAAEAGSTQIVTVTTENIPGSGSLLLSLAGKSYLPTDVSQGTARFTIPGGDLSALPLGIASLAVNGSAGTLSAPELLYSFTVDTSITPAPAPHITGIAPAFGGVLDLDERNSAQAVVVSTSDIADGQALTLRLNGKTYAATTAGNQASFSVPAADLQGLPAGLSSLQVTPTGQSTPSAAFTISVERQAPPSPPHILSIQPSFGSLLSSAEAQQNQTVLVTTAGVQDNQRIALLTDGLSLFGSVSNNRALFTLTPDQLQALAVGLQSFSVAVANRAGVQAPEAELSFSVEGAAAPPLPHMDQLSPSFGSLLDASEALQDQTVVVDTTGFQSGDQLTLAIESNSFTAAIEANAEARFTIPRDVLGALLPGVSSMTVSGSTASGTVAPSLTRSFSVDGDLIVPLITGIDPSFGASLDPQEAEKDQSIAVLTSRMADGQAITLQLNNKSYDATVNNNNADFVLPTADLKALPVGLDLLLVRASGSGAPDTSQAFSVLPKTTNPDGGSGGGSGTPGFGVLLGTPRPDELVGSAREDTIIGRRGHDRLFGFAGLDRLKGQEGRDDLRGGDGPDVLIGGHHADRLSGGLDSDRFRFLDVRDSPAAQPRRQDVIRDLFSNDRIDLSAFEPALTFIAAAPFSGVQGEVRFASRRLSVDLDGDAKADFLVHVNATVSADQLIL